MLGSEALAEERRLVEERQHEAPKVCGAECRHLAAESTLSP